MEQQLKLDGRTTAAKMFNEMFAAYQDEVGPNITTAQKALCRRAASLEVNLRREETRSLGDPDYESEVYAKMSGELSRTLVRIGLLPGIEEAKPDSKGLHCLSLQTHMLRNYSNNDPRSLEAADLIDQLMLEGRPEEADQVWVAIENAMNGEPEKPASRTSSRARTTRLYLIDDDVE